MLSNKDVDSWYTGSEHHDVNGPSEFLKIARIFPVDLHSAFYSKGVQSILWNLSKSHQWNSLTREWQPTKTPFIQEGLLSSTRTNSYCCKTRQRDQADVMPQDVQCPVLYLPQLLPLGAGTQPAAPQGLGPGAWTALSPAGSVLAAGIST